MEKPAACLLCGKSVLASNRRYLLVRVSSGVRLLTRLGEALENACGRKVPAELPEKEFACNACRERVEKAARLRQELAESLDRAAKKFQQRVQGSLGSQATAACAPGKRFLSPTTAHTGVSPMAKRPPLRWRLASPPSLDATASHQPPKRTLFPRDSSTRATDQQGNDPEQLRPRFTAPSPETPSHSSRIPIRTMSNVGGIVEDVTFSVKVGFYL